MPQESRLDRAWTAQPWLSKLGGGNGQAGKKEKSRARRIPKVRIVRPARRPFQLRYDCPIEKRQVRISIGCRDDAEAERQKEELEAKLLLGLETRPGRDQILGPDMEWSDFREQYRTLHLATLRDSTAMHAESRLDLAERIMKPKTLGGLGRSKRLAATASETAGWRTEPPKKASLIAHCPRLYEQHPRGIQLGSSSRLAANRSQDPKDQDSEA